MINAYVEHHCKNCGRQIWTQKGSLWECLRCADCTISACAKTSCRDQFNALSVGFTPYRFCGGVWTQWVKKWGTGKTVFPFPNTFLTGQIALLLQGQLATLPDILSCICGPGQSMSNFRPLGHSIFSLVHPLVSPCPLPSTPNSEAIPWHGTPDVPSILQFWPGYQGNLITPLEHVAPPSSSQHLGLTDGMLLPY